MDAGRTHPEASALPRPFGGPPFPEQRCDGHHDTGNPCYSCYLEGGESYRAYIRELAADTIEAAFGKRRRFMYAHLDFTPHNAITSLAIGAECVGVPDDPVELQREVIALAVGYIFMNYGFAEGALADLGRGFSNDE